MRTIREIILTSRPRFWLYTAGPYIVGYCAGAGSLMSLQNGEFWVWFLYFLIPVNIFLYGTNDWFDADTDALNKKKDAYEQRMQLPHKVYIKFGIILTFVLTILLVIGSHSVSIALLTLFMVLLIIGYSVPPIRFKARPVVDSISNVLYVIPGFIGYFQSNMRLPVWQVMIAVWCWAAAMHLFSAVPDIVPDKIARLRTTAVVLGRQRALWLCFLLWSIFSGMFIAVARTPLSVALVVYPCIPLLLLRIGQQHDERIYRFFPAINTVFGFGFFITLVL